MALTRGRLSNVTAIAGAANANVVTVANNKKVYVKSIAIHDGGATGGALLALLTFMWFQTVVLLEMLLECLM